MSVNAPETPVQAEVIFVLEATSAMFPYVNELKTNYIIPTLEYFHGGTLEEGSGNGSVYCLVTYVSADCYPSQPVGASGPFSTPQELLDAFDKIECIGGQAETFACMTEALVMCMDCFDDLGHTELPKHVILLSISQPYSAYGGGIAPHGVATTPEQAARLLAERGVNFSIAAAKRWTVLATLYEQAGGDLHQAQQRNYAKDPRHQVLLRGYSLKERPPSPAPPPAPETQADTYNQPRAAAPRPAAPFPRAPPRAWLSRPQLYNNSALLTQLAQPSYPPPPPPMAPQRLPGMHGSPSGAAPQAAPQPLQRNYIWSGVLEWMEKGKTPSEQKVNRLLPCQVTVSSKDVEPELKVDTWPNKLLMQLMPKQMISSIGGQYLKDSKSVLFHLQPNEALDDLTKLMVNNFAGCVHFTSNVPSPVCEIKVLILLYTPEKKAYLGFIPNNQATFVDRLRKVIQQQKITQVINKQQSPAGAGTSGVMGGNMPSSSMPGTSGMSLNIAGSMPGPSGLAGAAQPPQMPMQPQQQGIMMGGMGQKPQGPRPVTQLDGLEAARQQNLEKIQHLQQTLEAAHQQEAQFKSQMDIMSHLHAAQAQEQHYKQLEEQQRKHQLQQQIAAQLRAAPPRLLRPHHPANPGLRHLLQQQPQYRPGGAAPRPTGQTQQFEDVNNYSDFI